jgi:NtrC-family two-component system sensor histidine kinase KinB
MTAYSSTVKIKLGLIVAAGIIAIASLWYTNRLANRVQLREVDYTRLWTRALQYQYESQVGAINPHQDTFVLLEEMIRDGSLSSHDVPRSELLNAVRWARRMPPPGETIFVSNEIVIPNRFEVPTVVTDTTGLEIVSYRNVGSDSLSTVEDSAYVRSLVADLDDEYDPLRIDLNIAGYHLAQVVHFGESSLVKQLRMFPFVQLFFVALFIFVGYMGFSHIRRNEQSNLWVGMAKEAAHQLGTPLSSMLGWIEMLESGELETRERVALELGNDVARLQRVANRFSKIGSQPDLAVTALNPAITTVFDYMSRRIPNDGGVKLTMQVPEDLAAPLNSELFEWVVENLVKNGLDAMGMEGALSIIGYQDGQQAVIDVIDTGKGIEFVNWKNVFRPGYSTKKRGWGLGLSLARRIVEDYHGGSLSLAASKPGEGTTFRIRLPL